MGLAATLVFIAGILCLSIARDRRDPFSWYVAGAAMLATAAVLFLMVLDAP